MSIEQSLQQFVKAYIFIYYSVKLSLMNIQTKNNRDHLGPVNTNLSRQLNRQASKQKIAHTGDAKGLQGKIQGLCEAIQNLKNQNQSMNAIIRAKNQEIYNLKNQVKNNGQSTVSGEKKSTRQIYYLNNFSSNNNESGTVNSTQLNNAILQIRILTKQRDDLIKRCEQLQAMPLNPTKSVITHELQKNVKQADIINQQNQQHAKTIQQYEQHIASMASKLSTVHKLQNQVAQLSQERNLILQDFEGMRGQLINRIGYCQHLQNQLRMLQQNQKGPNHADLQNLINKNNYLQSQISKLSKILKQRDDKIAEIQISKSGYVQVTKQAFASLQANIGSLQQKLNQATETQRKQAEKSTSLQMEINKLNRELTEKSRKIQTESQQLKFLHKQKSELNEALSQKKNDLRNLQRKLQDKTYQLDKLRTQNEKNKKLALIAQQTMPQLQNYKRKTKQYEQLTKKLKEQINKLQLNYSNITNENKKALDFVAQSKSKWQSYQRIMKKQSEQIFKLNGVCSQRLDQIDGNIAKNLNLQAKLREYVRQHQDLTDQVEQYIKQNHYVKSTEFSY